MIPPILARLEGFAVLAIPLLLGMALVGFLIRRDLQRVKRGEPFKVWYLRDKVYPGDFLYDSLVLGYIKPYIILFFILAGIFLLATWVVFFAP